MKLLSWNCRGVGGPRAVRSLRDVVRTHRPSILGLIETKEDGDWELLKHSLGFKDCWVVSSQGRSGGLALMWTEEVDVQFCSKSRCHIDVEVIGDCNFFLTLFYGSPKVQERVGSWDLLRKLKRDSSRPWMVMGDFNEVLYSWEMRSTRDRQQWQMRNFRHCLEDCGLTDVGFKGVTFTYTNRRKGDQEVRARLDRVVANYEWRMAYPQAVVKHGFANASDHCPLIIYLEDQRLVQRRKVKRFKPMWVRHQGFTGVVRKAWTSQSNDITLSEKLEQCMNKLNQWSSSTFGRVKDRVRELKENIQSIKEGPRTEEMVKKEAVLSEELDEWLLREELWWRQRSRAEWLRHGDRNTAYFHAKASQRRKRNHISQLRNSTGEFCETESEIASIITTYFTDIFRSQVMQLDSRWDRHFEGIPRLVTDEMNSMLTAPFTEGEIKRALFQIHPTKAPGLDGFPALFYHSNWSVVGHDVVKEVLSWLNGDRPNPKLNETLIVLVPKVKTVERVEELRPISLCNVVMKIITKALANRLKEVLPAIISQSQSAFIRGRLITDNILIAHEISHCIMKKSNHKTGFISLKLDMSKAYDRIEWKFLEKMMLVLGFAESWVRKIRTCVETVSYRVRINDHISEVIKPSRGLRQGDPISPYLFLLCAEWLTHTLNKYQELGLIEGVKICKNAPIVTHLMFADDCMLFLKARAESVAWIRDILKNYEEVSGQKINYMKSEGVCSKGVADAFKDKVKDRLQVSLVDSHSVYLGLPLIFSNKKVEMFRMIEERALKKVSDWKHKLLSSAGREVLIKSVLQAIPMYAMSCFRIPHTLCLKLARSVLNFWWNGAKGRGIHWLKAEELYKDRDQGGIGFKKMELMNLAFLAKQGWRIGTEPDLLVSKLFKARYFPNTDFLNAVKGSSPSFAWRGIHDALDIIRHGAEWDTRRNKCYWKYESSGNLSVRSAYMVATELNKSRLPSHGEQSDSRGTKNFWKMFWKLKVPSKWKIFGWRLYHDALPTMHNLLRRGCQVQNYCTHCGVAGELSLHLFRDCWWMRSLLQDLNLPREVWNNQCGDSGYWLWMCAKVCSGEEFISLLCGLWLGWKNRNEIVHGKSGSYMEYLKTKLSWLVKEVKGGGKVGSKWPEHMVNEFDGHIVFCDGSFDPESRVAGVGTIIKGNGLVVGVRAQRINHGYSVLETELKAMELGMKSAQELKLDKVLFVTDCSEVVWALNLGSWRLGVDSTVIKDCIKRLEEHPGWSVEGISRENNEIADKLARKARAEGWVWSDLNAVPRELLAVLSSSSAPD
ncbi:unnamed protein product [Rhodiola kirilowii]